MKSLRFLWVVCGLLLQAHAVDRETFTFTHYNLDVRIEPEQRRLAVRGKITLRNDSASPQKILSLQISSSLDWRSIRLEGQPAQFVSQPYTSDIDHTGALSEALVTLPQAVPPKSEVEFEIGYEGIIPGDATRLTRIGVPAELARHSDWDQIAKSFSAVRGIGYVAWYPIATESANLSDGNSVAETVAKWKAREMQSDMKIKIIPSGKDTPLILRCNGKPGDFRSEEHTGRPYETGSECDFEPLGDAVPLFAIGPYEELDQSPMKISYLPEHKEAAQTYASAVRIVPPFVTEWFGTLKAPAGARAEIVELTDPQALPYEGGSLLLTPLNNDSRSARLAAVHQLAHASFPSARPWIYEGLAHFAQAVYREQESGRQMALDYMGSHLDALVEAEKSLDRKRSQNTENGESLINTNLEDLYRSKASYVWWMLRDMIGDDALKKALATYRPDADTAPSYMQQLIEAQTKSDLGWFFDDWVYRDRGLPDFKVAAVYPWEPSRNAFVVTVTVENLGNAGAEVPLTLMMAEGQTTKRLLVHGKSKAIIRMEANSAPREIVVNDGSVPESDLSNNEYKIDAPANKN